MQNEGCGWWRVVGAEMNVGGGMVVSIQIKVKRNEGVENGEGPSNPVHDVYPRPRPHRTSNLINPTKYEELQKYFVVFSIRSLIRNWNQIRFNFCNNI